MRKEIKTLYEAVENLLQLIELNRAGEASESFMDMSLMDITKEITTAQQRAEELEESTNCMVNILLDEILEVLALSKDPTTANLTRIQVEHLRKFYNVATAKGV